MSGKSTCELAAALDAAAPTQMCPACYETLRAEPDSRMDSGWCWYCPNANCPDGGGCWPVNVATLAKVS